MSEEYIYQMVCGALIVLSLIGLVCYLILS
jgi:hypothetical protein